MTTHPTANANSVLTAGTIVTVRSTGERGVVMSDSLDDMVSVALGSGVQHVHTEDLEVADPEATQLLQDGRLGDVTAYGLRLQSLYLRHAYRFDPLSGLSNARIEPQPHQVFSAWRINQKIQPRMILADEVGLGKTIEAGLVIKELRAKGLANRVLIVCPASLQLQWQQELKTKFNETFEIIDGAAVKHLGRGGTNPWSKHDGVICSLPFASHRNRVESIIETDWDLVVFDEAHRVRRSKQGRRIQTTQAYRLADELKELVSGVLLLTATPMQLDPFELYSLIEIVEPGLFPNESSYETQRRTLPKLNQLIRLLNQWDALSVEEQVGGLADYGALLTGLVPGDPAAALQDSEKREHLIDVLADRHPLAGVMIRNRKSEVGGFVGREAESVLVDLTDEELELYNDITEYCRDAYDLAMKANNNAVGFLMVTYQKMLASSSHAIRASFEKRIVKLRKARSDARSSTKGRSGPDDEQADAEEISDVVDEFEGSSLQEELLELEIATLENLVARLGKIQDSKAFELLDALDALFGAHPDEKVIIFTTFKETQTFLRQLLEANGHTVSVFNGSMNLDEKEDAVRAFRNKHRVLISTEAGGEGRNFQFCHIIVNYDLPWNPMKVEQRIGRVDRIGQKRQVQIWNLACRKTLEVRVLSVLERRIGLFEESVGSLDPILGSIEADLTQLVMSKVGRLGDESEAFELGIEQRVKAARDTERRLADFALDRTSFRRDVVNELLGQRSLANYSDLERFTSLALDQLGGGIFDHADGGKSITLSPAAAQKLRVRGPTIRGCFDPADALRLEELQFFAFGNDFIDRVMKRAEEDAPATAARVDPLAPPGGAVEIWYEIEATDIKPTGRFVRHVVADDLVVRVEDVRELPQQWDRPLARVEVPGWVQEAIAASQKTYRDEFGRVREAAKTTLAERQDEARHRARRIFEYRQERLQAIIADELAWIEKAERGTDEKQKKVLPARRGKLERRRESLQRLRQEHDETVAAIDALEPKVTGRILAAGVVVPQ